jgi:hypothetical protein
MIRIIREHVRLPVVIRLNANRRTLVSFRPSGSASSRMLRLSIHRMFCEAPDDVLMALATWLDGRQSAGSKALLRGWMNRRLQELAQEPATIVEQLDAADHDDVAATKDSAEAPPQQLDLFGTSAPEAGVAQAKPVEPSRRRPLPVAMPARAAKHHQAPEPARTPNGLPEPPCYLEPHGRYHDLREIADIVNYQYFEGKCPVHITWGSAPDDRLPEHARARAGSRHTRRPARRRTILLGTYHAMHHLVRIHPRLDAPDIPRWFVEYVVYHEMLHKFEPPKLLPNGRRDVHSRAFRTLERRFARYREVRQFEKSVIRAILLGLPLRPAVN